MLLPRISLLGQIIQLSVCLLLIPKLGGGSTYHLFCRLVFLQNTTIKIALAVIKMAQRQIWRRAKTRGMKEVGGNCRGYILSSNEKVDAVKQQHCYQSATVQYIEYRSRYARKKCNLVVVVVLSSRCIYVQKMVRKQGLFFVALTAVSKQESVMVCVAERMLFRRPKRQPGLRPSTGLCV